jgi:methionine-S-sulfoxide reductase
MKTLIVLLITALTLGGTVMVNADGPREIATFAGGCFWCMEPPFDKLDGVVSTVSGYLGGPEENPTYKEVAAGRTGHAETVQITYDPSRVSYSKLLEVFWMQIDPTTPDRQFVDTGRQYRSAIFYQNEEQQRLAEESKKKMENSGLFGAPIVTEIVQAGVFWPAEDYHQDYYMKNPLRYKYYRFGSGRDQYLKKIWGGKAGHGDTKTR